MWFFVIQKIFIYEEKGAVVQFDYALHIVVKLPSYPQLITQKYSHLNTKMPQLSGAINH